uniref:Uncharacterized protein n=1 Tax=Tanacetum cinerariifolium TaxID=118510 RepID=A0A6L2MZ39_TANCI|nr:hypothetical protein [Tanacetum cinerariifolium]
MLDYAYEASVNSRARIDLEPQVNMIFTHMAGRTSTWKALSPRCSRLLSALKVDKTFRSTRMNRPLWNYFDFHLFCSFVVLLLSCVAHVRFTYKNQ